MGVELPLETMSVAEKLQLLEAIWDSLCRTPGNVQSPEWHRAVLGERAWRLVNSQASISSWSDAKARLLRIGNENIPPRFLNVEFPSMNAALEFHDSRILAIDLVNDAVIVRFSAYVHRSSGRPGIDPGTGWLQSVDMMLTSGVIAEQPTALPCWISDGRISGLVNFEYTIPLPCSIAHPVCFEAEGAEGERVTIHAEALRILGINEGTFIEEFP